jgi:hypothetical protein
MNVGIIDFDQEIDETDQIIVGSVSEFAGDLLSIDLKIMGRLNNKQSLFKSFRKLH